MEESASYTPLGKVFSELAKAYAGTFTERLKGLPIHRYYYALVVIETYQGDLNQTTLAEELYMDKASVVRMLDYLEAEDCILRKQNPQDRRAHILELTPKALQMIPEIKKALHDTNAICVDQAKQHGIPNLEAELNRILSCLQLESGGSYNIHFVHRDE